MKRLFPLVFVLCLALGVAGCAAPDITKTDDIPPATISKAAFVLGQPMTVTITGDFFKIKSDNKQDVVCSINARNWVAAKAIVKGSPTSYTADLPYGVSFPEVWVRVMGVNGEYSDIALVHGQQ